MDIKNILVAGQYEEEFYKQLPENFDYNLRFIRSDDVKEEDLRWADGYVGFSPSLSFNLQHLKWVHSFNAGVNNFLDLDGWMENDVLLTRTICSFGKRISEYCLSYVLRELQFHTYFEDRQRQKEWAKRTPGMVQDQKIVVFGTGEIGQEVARTFTQLGATVCGVSQSGKEKEHFKKVVDTSATSELLSDADWVISTLPLTKATQGLFNSQLFSYFNRAAFINVGRGATVDEQALLEALDAGKVRHAVLDVFKEEPLPKTSPLWKRENVFITPHISAVTELDEAIACFLETLKRIENNEKLPNKVDFSRGY